MEESCGVVVWKAHSYADLSGDALLNKTPPPLHSWRICLQTRGLTFFQWPVVPLTISFRTPDRLVTVVDPVDCLRKSVPVWWLLRLDLTQYSLGIQCDCMGRQIGKSHFYGVSVFVSVANEIWSQVKVGVHLRMRLEQCARLMVRMTPIGETSHQNLIVCLDDDSAVFCWPYHSDSVQRRESCFSWREKQRRARYHDDRCEMVCKHLGPSCLPQVSSKDDKKLVPSSPGVVAL